MSMKMAKASQADLDAANEITNIVQGVDKGYYPSREDAPASDPMWFDADDHDHLRHFYDRIMECAKRAPGGMGRVTWGMSTIMGNSIVNPDADVLELHPRIVAALALIESQRCDAAPKNLKAELRRVMDLLDTELGDSDHWTEGLSQDEIEEEYPVFTAMQIVVALHEAAPDAEPAGVQA